MRTGTFLVRLAAALLFVGPSLLQAAEGGELDSSEFEATLEGLTPDEKDAMREAYREFAGTTTGTERPTTEGSGRTAPELIGLPIEIGNLPQNLTPQEQSLMGEANALEQNLQQQGFSQEQIQQQVEQQFGERFREIHPSEGDFRSGQPGERDDLRLRELYEAGAPVGEALERRDQGFEQERGSQEHGSYERETIERGFGREQMERERQQHELPGREIDQPERSFERPEMERPSVEMERPQIEAPEIYREFPEMQHPENERPAQEYQPPQS